MGRINGKTHARRGDVWNMKNPKNIKDFDSFLNESTEERTLWVVSENAWPVWSEDSDEKEWMIVGVYLNKKEAEDKFYEVVSENYEGDEVWECIESWFEGLNAEERELYGIPEEMDADDFSTNAHEFDFYKEVWRECVDGVDDTFDIADLELMNFQELRNRIGETIDSIPGANERATFMRHINEFVDMPDSLKTQIKKVLRGTTMFGL